MSLRFLRKDLEGFRGESRNCRMSPWTYKELRSSSGKAVGSALEMLEEPQRELGR